MPPWVPPPAPVSEERAKEILADPRVAAQQKRDKPVRSHLAVLPTAHPSVRTFAAGTFV